MNDRTELHAAMRRVNDALYEATKLARREHHPLSTRIATMMRESDVLVDDLAPAIEPVRMKA
jgi:D-alanyl-D-alanine carboxypeptidase